MRNQQPGLPQPWLRQQTGVNDMQLRQQHFIYKKIQELQRQQQLDQEVGQQNSLNPLSAIAKQAPGDQLSSLVSGAPIHDPSTYMWQGQPVASDSRIPSTSQMLTVGNTNWVHRNGSPAMQGFPNGLMFSQELSQASRSMGFVPQQLDQSLYGSPVATTRDTLNQYSHLQGITNDGADMFSKASGNQVDKTITQSAAFNAFQCDQSGVFPNQVCVSDGVLVSSQGLQGKNLFGHIPMSSLQNGILSENFQLVNSLPRSVQVQEFHDKQEQQVSWEGNLQEKVAAQVEQPSQGLVTLDPTEAKILFDTDEGVWDNSFGRIGGMSAEGYVPGNQLEGNDYLSALPSVQSGSWSALMQSAVAEASSSDTGLQDEWSGLSFQKTELSTENRATALNDSGKQPATWVDNDMQTASSLSSRPFPLFDDSNMSTRVHGVLGFQQHASCGSLQQSPKESSRWLDWSPQQKSLVEGSFHVQTPMRMDNTQESAWGSQIYERSRGSAQSADMGLNSQNIQSSLAHHQSMPGYSINNQSSSKPNGWNINESLSRNEDTTLKILDNENVVQHPQNNEGGGSMHMESDHDSRMRKSDSNIVAISFPKSTGGFELGKSGMSSPQVYTDPYMNNFTALPNSSTSKINQEMNQQVQHSHHLDYGKHAMFDSSMYRNNENVGMHQHQPSQCLDVRESSVSTSDRASGDTYDKKHENYHQKEISDSYMSGHSHPRHPTVGDGMRENAWSVAMDTHPLVSSNKNSVGQIGRKSTGSRKFQYHPMGNLGVDMDSSVTTKHVSDTQGLSQLVTRGVRSQEQGYFVQSKPVGNAVSNNSMDLGKVHLPDLRRNAEGMEDFPSRSVHPGYESAVSAPFDRSTTFNTPNKRTLLASQNMLELLHKVDQSRENNLTGDSSDHNQSEMLEAAAADGSVAYLHHSQSSGSQGYGLRLAPPSQQPSASNHGLPSQTSSQTTDDLNSRHDQEGNSAGTVPAGVPFPRNQLQQQDITSTSGQVADQPLNHSFSRQADMLGHSKHASRFRPIHDSHGAEQSVQASFSGTATRTLPFNLGPSADSRGLLAQCYSSSAVHSQPMDANSSYMRPSCQQTPVSQLPVTSGMSHGGFSSMLQNVWTNVTSQQHLPGGPSSKPPHLFQSICSSTSNLEPASWTPRKADDQGVSKGGNGPSEFGPCSTRSEQLTQGDEQPCKDSSLRQMPHKRINLAGETAGSFQEHETLVHPHQRDLGRGMPGQEHTLISQTALVPRRNSNNSNNEIESFGRSLKSSGNPHHHYSLLNQMQAMRGVDHDPSRRSAKKLKGAEFGADAQEAVAKTGQRFAMVRDPVENEHSAAAQHMHYPPSDSKMLCFSSEGREDRNAIVSSNLRVGDEATLKDMVMFGRNGPQNYSGPLTGTSTTSLKGNEHSRINPQMAPSWFERFGTYRNGQILPMPDGVDGSQRDAKMAAQQFLFGKVSEGSHTNIMMEKANAGNANQTGSIWQGPVDSVPAGEHFSSHPSLPLEKNLAVVRASKCKTATLGPVPWHKEVTQCSQRLRRISMADHDWAQAANRLIEKVEDESEMVEDGPPMARPRRRIIVTTHLMQHLFRSIPAAIMSGAATSEYEGATYFSAKLALGDACSLMSCSGSDCSVHPNCRNMISGRAKASGAGDRFLKVVEDSVNRGRKLENDLLRLDKRVSILDIRGECQELEKISVFNRFARFHGRGNADAVESSSSSDATSQKSYPKKHVTALPLPRNLPEGIPCLSL